MCGRFALHANEQEIREHFHLKSGFVMKPRYNIAPGQVMPIIHGWPAQVEFARFGYIPSWVKSEQSQVPAGHINARFETLLEKPSFKAAVKKQRCLIPASGYYEWRLLSGKKQPFYLYIKNQPLIGIAGIWSVWRGPLGPIFTCAIVTLAAKGDIAKIHDRMPMVIAPQYYQAWLSEGFDSEKAESFALNFHAGYDYAIRPVSPRMSHPQFEGAECIQSL